MPPHSTPGRRAMGGAFPTRPSSGGGSARPTLSGKGVIGSGGKGRGVGGRGVGVNRMKRQRKLLKDTIQGITKGDIRRMARRGGVKRISAMIYSDMREAMKAHLEKILRDVAYIVEYQARKTVTVTDVIFVLKKQGRPIYGFDPDSHTPGRYAKRVS